MKVGEAKELATLLLKGDNSNATINNLILKQAILDIATRCEPQKLTTKEQPTKIYRKIIDQNEKITAYIREPIIGGDDEELDIDEELAIAVVFFVCAYLSHKSKDYFEAKGERVIALFKSNSNSI